MTICALGRSIMLTVIFASGISNPLWAKAVRTPVRYWQNVAPDVDRNALVITHRKRQSAIRVSTSQTPPGDEDVTAIMAGLFGQKQFRFARINSKNIGENQVLQRGLLITLDDGRKMIYYMFWKKRGDGMVVASSLLVSVPTITEDAVADLKLATGLNNQMLRGAVPILAAPLASPTTVANILFAAPPPPSGGDLTPKPQTQPQANPLPLPPKIPTAAPAQSALITPTLPPSPGALSSYPYKAAPGAGPNLSQIASLIYAPEESAEVYVFFKDGSFHENLPVALEDWDVQASKQGDPDSWGRWKPTSEKGEFELDYASGDNITISGTRVKPAHGKVVLYGLFSVESDLNKGEDQLKNSIIFAGNTFASRPPQRTPDGNYTVEGYTMTLNFNDGRIERRPFFIIPAESKDDDPAIWFGEEIRYKQ